MHLLLDSHILLWWDRDLSRLSSAQREAIGDADNLVFVSAATSWEIAIKQSVGKLNLRESVTELARRFGFRELPILLVHGATAAILPLHHKDPFDRMLIAQAISEQMMLVTSDRKLLAYSGLKLLS